MSQKRQPSPARHCAGLSSSGAGSSSSSSSGGGSCTVEKKRPRTRLQGVISEVMRANNLQRLIRAIEPLVRTVVREEVDIAFKNYITKITRQNEKLEYSPTLRSLQLQFTNKLSLPIFTGAKIEGENSSAINISLVDAFSGQVVALADQLLLKVDLIVLEGDFEGGQDNNWSAQDFASCIVKEREGKKQLLGGDLTVNLSQGVGSVGELYFTDNSSWTRSRKFRLGGRIEDGYCNGIRIREAMTESFMVKDHRGELYKKHHPPALEDEVWRLEKIGKDGAFHKRLSKENINTVKDFLTLLRIDASNLRNILGNGMSAKMWDTSIEHALTCDVGNKVHVYYPEYPTKSGIVFNVIGEVKGLLSEQQFIPAADLTEKDKEEAHTAVKLVHGDWDKLFACDFKMLMSNPSEVFHLMALPSVSESIAVPRRAETECFSLGPSTVLSPDVFSLEGPGTMDVCTLQSMVSVDEQLPQEVMMTEVPCPEDYLADDLLQFADPAIVEASDLASVLRGFIAVSTSTLSKPGRPYRGWRMLSCVIGLVFYVKRIVARRRKAAAGGIL